jgi:hypothetical protein
MNVDAAMTPTLSDHSVSRTLTQDTFGKNSSQSFEKYLSTHSTSASTYGGTSIGTSESIIKPLLKVSPPTPHGSHPGRYKVLLQRATLSQPFDFAIEQLGDAGPLVIGEDEERLGLRKGDEVIRINGQNPRRVEDAKLILDRSKSVELHLQHHEKGFEHTSACFDELDTCGLGCNIQRQTFKVQHPLRPLLATSGPVQLTDDSAFQVQILRTSLVQPLGLGLVIGPEEAVLVKQDFPQYGLLEGDRVISINNICVDNLRFEEVEAFLDSSMDVWLECHRDGMTADRICEALLLDDLEEEMAPRSSASSCWDTRSEQDTQWSQHTGNRWLAFSLFGACTGNSVCTGKGRSWDAEADVIVKPL